MAIGSFLGVLGMLGLVLGLLLLTLKLIKRYVPTASDANARVSLSIVQRLALSPKQGIAIVKIGEQLVAVSVGEGGVRPILELPSVPAVSSVVEAGPVRAEVPADFRRLLTTAIKSTMTFGIALAIAASSAVAQAPATKAPAAATPGLAQTAKPAAVARTKAAGVPLARVDTMLTKLAPNLDLRVGNDKAGGLRLSGTVGVVVMMGLLTLLPTLVLMMTGFTRILIVLHFLRQAIGTQTAPPAQLIAGLALLLTGFVMAPTLREVNRVAIEPWMDGKIEQTAMLADGVKPFRTFMLRQTRDRDLATFMTLSHEPPVAKAEDVPLIVLMSAFVTSELRTAFQIGFALFLPFIVIDVVVAAVLMSMGMMMLPPAMISLPFKLLLFVLVDGWALIVEGLVRSFH